MGNKPQINHRLICTHCKTEQPASKFSDPASKRPVCQTCDNTAIQQLLATFGGREFTSKEALPILRTTFTALQSVKNHGGGPLLQALCKRNPDRLIAQGTGYEGNAAKHVYRIAMPEVAPSQPLNIRQLSPDELPRSKQGHQSESAFLEVGAHGFPITSIAKIERDDRGRATITLVTSETDIRTGRVSPVEVEFTPEEWAARRLITLAEFGQEPGRVTDFERIARLEQQLAEVKKKLCVEELARIRITQERDVAVQEKQRIEQQIGQIINYQSAAA